MSAATMHEYASARIESNYADSTTLPVNPQYDNTQWINDLAELASDTRESSHYADTSQMPLAKSEPLYNEAQWITSMAELE